MMGDDEHTRRGDTGLNPSLTETKYAQDAKTDENCEKESGTALTGM